MRPPSTTTDDDLRPALRTMALFAGLPESTSSTSSRRRCDVSTAHPGQVVQAQDVPVRLLARHRRRHAVVQRDGTPIGLLGRGDSWSEHSLLNQLRSPIAVVALSPLTPAHAERAAILRDPRGAPGPGRPPGGPFGHLGRPPGPAGVQCLGPLVPNRGPSMTRRPSGVPVRLTVSRDAGAGGVNVLEEISLMRTLAGWCVRHRRIVVLLWLAVLVAPIFTVQVGRHRLLEQLQLPPHPVVRRHQPAQVGGARRSRATPSRSSSAPRATPA